MGCNREGKWGRGGVLNSPRANSSVRCTLYTVQYWSGTVLHYTVLNTPRSAAVYISLQCTLRTQCTLNSSQYNSTDWKGKHCSAVQRRRRGGGNVLRGIAGFAGL